MQRHRQHGAQDTERLLTNYQIQKPDNATQKTKESSITVPTLTPHPKETKRRGPPAPPPPPPPPPPQIKEKEKKEKQERKTE